MSYRKPLVFAAACVGMLMFGVSLLSMGSLLPSITARFSLDGTATGALVSLLPFGILAGSLIFGPIVDRFGYRVPLTLSGLLVSAGLATMAGAGGVGTLRLAILAIGFGGGILNGGTNALVADIATGVRGASLSLLGVFFGVGALGMPVLLSTLRGVDQSAVLAGLSAALLLPTGFIAVIAYPVPKHTHGMPIRQGLGLVKNGALLAIAFTLALQSGIESGVSNWTTTYLQSGRQFSMTDALGALTACVIGMTVARLGLAAVLQRVSGGMALLVGLGVGIAGLGFMAKGPGLAGAAAGLALIGIGLSVGFPLLMGYVADLFPTLSGTAFSVVLAIALIGNMLINYAVGVLSDTAGIGALPLFLSVGLAVEIAVAAVALRQYRRHMPHA